MASKAAKKCAYCSAAGPFTREHVIPAFLFKMFPQRFGFNPHAKTFVESEAQVRDVCKACNSGPLSKLDAYGKRFCDANRIARRFRKRIFLPFYYDYEMLSRWLLKIFYNADRAMSRATDLDKWVRFIVEGQTRPLFVEILVEVIQDYSIEKESERRHLPDTDKSSGRLTSHRFRVGRTVGLDSAVTARFLALNAFYLYAITAPSDDATQEAVRRLRARVRDAARLLPGRAVMKLRVSRRTVLNATEDQALRELPHWHAYQEQRRRRGQDPL